MSSSKLTKKQKKGLAFRERKGKKPQLSNALLEEELAVPQADLPAEEAAEHNAPIAQTNPVAKPKKRKRDAEESAEDDAEEAKSQVDTRVEVPPTKKIKRRKLDDDGNDDNAKPATGKTRFILFVGNLKYTTSLDAIQEHFASCDPPPQIRLLTPKPKSPASTTTKSKGCAFLEFSHRNSLQQGLKLHGSTLDGRRINVELTAGGGGKSEKRVQKVQARNKYLGDERKARVQKIAETGGDVNANLIAPPQRHSTTSGLEEIPQKRRTWTVPEDGEVSGRGGVKKRGKKGKAPTRHWGTGANAVAVG
ncbi:hypothetical protein JB92DRAFT_2847601 [Gautieria morchelliformis]|nr:hypothetical protein JB92DRAFT_2847601 [Gautieria morchelliformis]